MAGTQFRRPIIPKRLQRIEVIFLNVSWIDQVCIKHLTGVGLLVEFVGRRGDNAEVCSSSAKTPEQIRVRVFRYFNMVTTRRDHLYRHHTVNHQAKAAGEEPNAGTQRCANKANVATGTRCCKNISIKHRFVRRR